MRRFAFEVDHDALAVAELTSIPSGLLATDEATKAAEVHVIFAGSIHPGKFLLVLGGGVSETDLALEAAKKTGRKRLIDSVHLPFPHPQLRRPQLAKIGDAEPAIMSIETLTIPSLIGIIDRILKSTEVTLRIMQLADHMGGKSVAVLDGELADIEAASNLVQSEVSAVMLSDIQLIRRPSAQFVEALLASIRN